MPDRGRLFYDSNGKLRQVDPDANITGEPDAADLEPVEFVAVVTESVDIVDANGSGERREIAAAVSDADDTNALSLDLTGIGTYDSLILVVIVEGNGGGAASEVNIRLNSTTSGYDQDTLNGGTITETTGGSEWSFEMFDTNTVKERFTLTDGSNTTGLVQETNNTPLSRDWILRARCIQPNVNSIQISTSFNAAGSAYAIGVVEA